MLCVGVAACEADPGPALDAGGSDLGVTCETRTLPAPRVLTSTSGADFAFPRFDPHSGEIFSLLVVGTEPKDIVAIDDEGQVTRHLGLGAELRSVPTDFSLARHAPWVVFSGRAGISIRSLEPGPVHVILPGRLGIEPELSPDGRRLVFRENTRLYAVSLSEAGDAIGAPEEIVLTQGVGAMRPRHSRSGTELAYFMSGFVEIYDFARSERHVASTVVGQAHVAWLDAEALVMADDRGLSILRRDCVEALREFGPARQVDAFEGRRRVVFKSIGAAGLGLVEDPSP